MPAAAAILTALTPFATQAAATVPVGRSVEGRAIVAHRIGDPNAPRAALVVGSIHGEEPEGTRITKRLISENTAPKDTVLYVIRTANPDGLRKHSRTNAHGVDLNRNWARGFRRIPTAGPRPFSEPETRALRTFINNTKPDVTIWFHQPWGQVLAPCTGKAPRQQRYARASKLPLKRCRGQGLPGTATRWQNATAPGSTAFVVELGPGRLNATQLARHTRATRAAVGP